MGTLEQKKLNKEKRDLLQSIDRGIEDMKAERELSVREAFQKITELRNMISVNTMQVNLKMLIPELLEEQFKRKFGLH